MMKDANKAVIWSAPDSGERFFLSSYAFFPLSVIQGMRSPQGNTEIATRRVPENLRHLPCVSNGYNLSAANARFTSDLSAYIGGLHVQEPYQKCIINYP